MATTMTLLEVRTATRQRADMVNSAFITDAELNSYINQSYFELYDLLVQNYGAHYFVGSPFAVSTDGVTEFYPLPADFYKLVGISLKRPGDQGFSPMKQGSFSDMQRLSGINGQSFVLSNTALYSLNANSLWLAPVPQAGQVIRMFYVPRLTTLANDTDTIDGISGWTEYVICDAAIKCKQKEESDVSVLAVEKAALMKRIEAASSNRDSAAPSTISDVNECGAFGRGVFW